MEKQKFTNEQLNQLDKLFNLDNKGLIKLYILLLRYRDVETKHLTLEVLLEDYKQCKANVQRNLKKLQKLELVEFEIIFINKKKTTLITKINQL
jgi:hypothetical protein